MTLMTFLALFISVAAVFISLYGYRKLYKEVELNRHKIAEAREESEDEGGGNEEGEMDVQEVIEEEAEELFKYLKEVHDFEEVTTYTELVSKIQGMNVEDEKRKKELLDFYDNIIKLEYSDGDISTKKKEELKEEAEELARTLEQSQGEPKQDK